MTWIVRPHRSIRRPRHLALAWICLATALLGVACRGDRVGGDVPISVDVATAPTPPILGPTRIVVTVHDSINHPFDDLEVTVEGTMTHAGMVPVIEEAEPSGPGQYVIPAFEFSMGGDWVLITRVVLPDGRVAVHETEVRVVAVGPAGAF